MCRAWSHPARQLPGRVAQRIQSATNIRLRSLFLLFAISLVEWEAELGLSAHSGVDSGLFLFLFPHRKLDVLARTICQNTKWSAEPSLWPIYSPVMQLIIHHQHFMRVIMHVLKGNAAAAAPVPGTPLSSTSGEPLSGEHMSISPERPR